MRWIEPARLLLEVDAELDPDQAIEVRITLSPTSRTALLNGRIARLLVTAEGESPRYLVDILSMSPGERALLEEWTLNIKMRGTFSRFENVISSHLAADRNDSQANAEVRQALQRMARRPLGVSGASPASSPQTDPFGVRSDVVTGAQQGAGRSAVRDALLGAIARGAAGRAAPPAPTTPPAPAPPPSATPASAPARPPGPGRVIATGATNPGFASPPVSRPQADPTYSTTQTRSAQWIAVHWHSPAAFDRDSRLQLQNYHLVLQRGVEHLPALEPLHVVLRHDDLHFECAATVSVLGAESATYRLLLDPLQIDRLRQWSADYGRK